MDIGKRNLLKATFGLGAGLAAATTMVRGQQPPAPVPGQGRGGPGRGGGGRGGTRSFAGSGKQTSMVDPNYKPTRVNKAIELWEKDQPVFYATYTPEDQPDGYEMGLAMAKTWCDAINVEMEQGSYDIMNLRRFMRGLADGGPTPSGHRTPMVFVTIPVTGDDEANAKAGAWQVMQVLAAGVHSVDICHASDPKAVAALIRAMRYPFDYPDTPKQKPDEYGLRGNGSQGFAANIWGVSANHYFHVADVWPLNPRGEISCGLKLEDVRAHARADEVLSVPGIAFAEWGSGDSTLSILGLAGYPDNPPGGARGGARGGGRGGGRGGADPRLDQARLGVLAACKRHKIMPLNLGNGTALENYKEGTRVLSGGNENAALEVREYAKRTMPI
jgi:4-hydroxy-2-oxoheptanedioate aldolase